MFWSLRIPDCGAISRWLWNPGALSQVVSFNQQMLAGCLARKYDVELEQCLNEGKKRIDAAIYSEVEQRIGGDTQRVRSVDTHYNAITFKHLLLPVWLMAYSCNNQPYQVFINAATGEVQGERPWSAVKITLAVLGGFLAAFGVWLVTQR